MKKKEQVWDKLFKVVGDLFPNELVDFLFQDKEIQFCNKFDQERIVLEYQIADINFWVEEKGVKKLLNIEPYSSWNPQNAAEVFTRNGIISKSLNYEYEVISVVILLAKKKQGGRYRTSIGRYENKYEFPVFTLAKVEEILKKYPPLAPFVLKVDLKYQEQVLEAIGSSKILKYVTVLILSKLGISQEEALQMVGAKLEEFRELMEIPIMKSMVKDLEAKAKAEGEAEGEAKGKAEGEAKEKREIAKNLLKAKVDLQLIATATGLTLEELKKIKIK